MRMRTPRGGTIAADIADYLNVQGKARIAEIHADVNARQRNRDLPEYAKASIRGALNSNKNGIGHDLFKCARRGLYSLSARGRALFL